MRVCDAVMAATLGAADVGVVCPDGDSRLPPGRSDVVLAVDDGPFGRGYVAAVTISRSRLLDGALALVLVVYGALDVFLTHEWRGNHWVTGAVVVCMALSLAWRRAAPFVTLVVPVAGLVLLSLLYGGSETGANLFILLAATYSVALYWRDPVAAAVVYLVTAVVHTDLTPAVNGVGDWLWEPVMFTLAFGVGLAMRSRQAHSEAMAERAESAAEEERRRIARELHDIVSHGLGVMVLQAGAADQVLERDPARAREALASIRAVGQEAIGEMGMLLGLIRGEDAAGREPQPSLADVGALVSRMREAGLAVELEVAGERRPLPAAVELSAYRIVQEGLTNALKHAGSARARVRLHYRPDDLLVEVADDGTGAAGAPPSTRRGLAGIGERVAVFGGRLEAGPRPDGGWTLRAAFPLGR
jgi:signal transduction histidine kinase